MSNTKTQVYLADHPLAELIPYACNARTHNDEQVNQIASSIKAFGFTNPVLIDEEGGVIAGHGRIMAAHRLAMTHIPTITLNGLTEIQKKAYIIADNQLALNAGWNMDMLKLELTALNLEGFELSLTGFSTDFLDDILLEEVTGLTNENAVPETPEEPLCIIGDLWLLGNHRLLCGDSTIQDHVDYLLDKQPPDLVFTDPPYGMAYGGGRARGNHNLNKKGGVRIKAHGIILGDDLEGDDLLQMISNSILHAVNGAKEGAAAYVCFTWRTYSQFHEALRTIGLEPKACIVWNKKSIGLGQSNYRPQHEFIFYCSGQWYGDKAQSDLWEMSRGSTGDYVHPTQKPVELIEKALVNSSKKGDIVHDCFGGSGSTLIACEKTHRHARIMELDAKFCDVIIQRWEQFTGLDAINADTQLSYQATKLQEAA